MFSRDPQNFDPSMAVPVSIDQLLPAAAADQCILTAGSNAFENTVSTHLCGWRNLFILFRSAHWLNAKKKKKQDLWPALHLYELWFHS